MIFEMVINGNRARIEFGRLSTSELARGMNPGAAHRQPFAARTCSTLLHERVVLRRVRIPDLGFLGPDATRKLDFKQVQVV